MLNITDDDRSVIRVSKAAQAASAVHTAVKRKDTLGFSTFTAQWLNESQWLTTAATEAARELVRAKLDTAKQLFDDQSRGALTGQAFSAKLKSL